MKIVNREALLSDYVAKNEGKTIRVPIFRGGRDANLGGGKDLMTKFLDVSPELQNADINEMAYKVMNQADAPVQADIDAFFAKTFIDLKRANAEGGDLTSVIAQEVTDFGMSKTVNVGDYTPYRGVMGTVEGANDAVPLIEQSSNTADTFAVEIKALGWKDTMANLLYNQWFSMDKIIKAASDADVDARNAATVGVIVGATYVASQKQAADATAGANSDELLYYTLVKGIKLLRGLKDTYTKGTIGAPSISILCNSANAWQVGKVVGGLLGIGRGYTTAGLPVASVIEYDRGINDGQTIGKKVASFPGVPVGKCYLFVPGVMMIANKRPLTMETGMGSVLELSTEERAWYRVTGGFYKQFLGSSFPGTAIGAGYGYVVEVTLPA